MKNRLLKGKNGEREVCRLLRDIIESVCDRLLIEPNERTHWLDQIRRNLAQSENGGEDICAFGLSIEIKRQEILNLDKWWMQCDFNARKTNSIPVLMYRQNRRKWRIMTTGYASYWEHKEILVDISYEDFKILLTRYIEWYATKD